MWLSWGSLFRMINLYGLCVPIKISTDLLNAGNYTIMIYPRILYSRCSWVIVCLVCGWIPDHAWGSMNTKGVIKENLFKNTWFLFTSICPLLSLSKHLTCVQNEALIQSVFQVQFWIVVLCTSVTPTGLYRYSEPFFRQFVLYCLLKCTHSMYPKVKDNSVGIKEWREQVSPECSFIWKVSLVC